MKHRFITFLTDFGLTDDFVGTCHGVMKRIAPDVQIIDVTHGITPLSVLAGALVLRNTLRYLPQGVHLAVVDPGVGSARRPIILRDAEGDLFVGPDWSTHGFPVSQVFEKYKIPSVMSNVATPKLYQSGFHYISGMALDAATMSK